MVNQLGITNQPRALGYNGSDPSTIRYVEDQEREVKSAKEAYYRWLSRLVMLFTILSLAFFAAASLVLFKLAPEVLVDPFLLIPQDSSENIVRYEPVMQGMASSKQIMQTFLRQYIIMRNTVVDDEREMQSRWFGGGVINYLSSPVVFDEFYRKQVEKGLPKFLRSHTVRAVEITSVEQEGGEKSRSWKIKFNTYDLSPSVRDEATGSMILITKRWTASLQAIFVPSRMFLARRLINPLGFTVIHYSQSAEQ